MDCIEGVEDLRNTAKQGDQAVFICFCGESNFPVRVLVD